MPLEVLEAFLKSLWIAQLAVMGPVWIWLLGHYKDRPNTLHVRLASTAFMILMVVDIYTIHFEQYPAFSVKAFAMLTAFAIADVSLFRFVVQIVHRP